MMITANTLGTTAELLAQDGHTGVGTYLLTGTHDLVSQSGQSCLQLTLEDASGRVTGFVWPECRPHISCPATPTPVSVTGTVQIYQSNAQLKIHTLAALVPDQVFCATALLPRRRCPDIALSALDRLAQLEQALPAPLDGFLRNVLLDPVIGLPLLRCRASVSHHHAYVGGLLVHSTAMLNQAAELTRSIVPHDVWSPYLAQLGYLLHDVGKIKSVGEVRRPQYALVVRHEITTIELLAPHLRWLEQRDHGHATALRHLFGYLATSANKRGIPNHVIAEVVATLDQLSAASYNKRDLVYLLEGGRNPNTDAARKTRSPSAISTMHRLGAAG